MKKFKVKYQVHDGYVGKSRPLYFYISESDIEDDMDDSDITGLFDEMVNNDFENRIFPEGENIAEFMEWAYKIQESREQQE